MFSYYTIQFIIGYCLLDIDNTEYDDHSIKLLNDSRATQILLTIVKSQTRSSIDDDVVVHINKLSPIF